MKSRHAARLIFKIDFKPVKKGAYYFDMTTLVLTKLLLGEINKDDRVLDMGTGISSIIGLTLWKRCGCFVICSDINPEIVSMAQENIEYNHASAMGLKYNKGIGKFELSLAISYLPYKSYNYSYKEEIRGDLPASDGDIGSRDPFFGNSFRKFFNF